MTRKQINGEIKKCIEDNLDTPEYQGIIKKLTAYRSKRKRNRIKLFSSILNETYLLKSCERLLKEVRGLVDEVREIKEEIREIDLFID